MANKTLKALFVNGSPRTAKRCSVAKSGEATKDSAAAAVVANTAQILARAAEGAASKGAQTEIVNLYDFRYSGCASCFACKLKDAKTEGVCAINDALRPLLQKAVEADIIVVGSPVYFSDLTGMTRSFLERFIFPNFSYDLDAEGKRVPPRLRKQTAMIFTMNVPEQILEQIQYDVLLGKSVQIMQQNFGHCESLFVCDTYQFPDYSRYVAGIFSEPDKRHHREEHFPLDLRRAYDLGCRLVENLSE